MEQKGRLDDKSFEEICDLLDETRGEQDQMDRELQQNIVNQRGKI